MHASEARRRTEENAKRLAADKAERARRERLARDGHYAQHLGRLGADIEAAIANGKFRAKVEVVEHLYWRETVQRLLAWGDANEYKTSSASGLAACGRKASTEVYLSW